MSEIKTIVIDCDGVLTDGKVEYHTNGRRSKQFHSRDITSIKRLIAAGNTIYIVSKSSWEGLKHFAKRCGCNYVTGVKDKAAWAKRVLKGQPFIAVCDDYDDLELCKMAWLTILPNDASILLKNEMWGGGCSPACEHEVLGTCGGSGIIEEVEGLLMNETYMGI
ncbi:MAG: hypothetical protein ACTHLE_03525 [Agriterribacter sp.]